MNSIPGGGGNGSNNSMGPYMDYIGSPEHKAAEAKKAQQAAETADYEQNLRDMYQNQISDYEKNTLPMVQSLQKEAESTKLVDKTRELANGLDARTREVTDRQLGYSMGGQLASQRGAMDSRRNLAVGRANSASVTQSYEDQRNKQQAARTQLMSISEQLQSSGTASMSQAYQAKTQRDEAYKAANSGFMSQAGAVAGGVIGGFFGGPWGASAGAAIGGAAGGALAN